MQASRVSSCALHRPLRLLTLFCMLEALRGQPKRLRQPTSSLQQQQDAAVKLRAQIIKDPGNPNLHLELATTLHGLDQLHPDGGRRIPEAERAYREAIRLTSPRAGIGLYTNLGALLMGSGRIDACLTALQTGIALAHEHKLTDSNLYCGALFNLGKAWGMQGKGAEAAEAYGQAIEASRGLHGSTYTKALASLKTVTPDQLAEMQQAVSFLSRASSGAEDDKADKKRRRRRRSKAADADMEQKWGFLTELDAADQSWLHFALYSAYQSQREYDKAWNHLAEANQLQRSLVSYDSQHDAMLFQVMQQVFPRSADPTSSDAFDLLLSGAAGCPSTSPIFVVGMPRSGSTLVEHILSSHPQAHGAGEDTAFAPLIPDLLHLLEGKGHFQDIRDLGKQYVDNMQGRIPPSRANATHVVDKMLRNVWNVGYISMMLPKSCIIQVVRHPMDTVLSCFAQPFEGRGTPWAWDLQDIAKESLMVDQISHHWSQVFPGRVLQMPYERIVADLESAARDMLHHCGLPWDESVLKFHQTQRTVQTASLAQVRQRLYNTSVGKWKLYQSYMQPAADLLDPMVKRYEEEYAVFFSNPGKSIKDEL